MNRLDVAQGSGGAINLPSKSRYSVIPSLIAPLGSLEWLELRLQLHGELTRYDRPLVRMDSNLQRYRYGGELGILAELDRLRLGVYGGISKENLLRLRDDNMGEFSMVFVPAIGTDVSYLAIGTSRKWLTFGLKASLFLSSSEAPSGLKVQNGMQLRGYTSFEFGERSRFALIASYSQLKFTTSIGSQDEREILFGVRFRKAPVKLNAMPFDY